MVRSKLRRFGSFALILVLLSALIVPMFVLSPAAITAEEFEEYCKYGVFTDCSVCMSIDYIDLDGYELSIENFQNDPLKIYGGIYFNDMWSTLKVLIDQDYGEVTRIDIDINFAVPFSVSQDLPTLMINGFISDIDIFPCFYTVDGDIFTCYDLSTSPEGLPQAIVPKFVFPEDNLQMINRLHLVLETTTASATYLFNDLFTTEHFSVYSAANSFAGYHAGYDEGYQVGYDEAADLVRQLYRNEYNRGYTNGYREGATSSQTAAKDEGYRIGLSEGYDNGFLEGKLEGISEGDYNLSFASLFFSLFDAPVEVVSGLLDFDFLGLNMFQFACSVLTLVLFVWLLKVLFL